MHARSGRCKAWAMQLLGKTSERLAWVTRTPSTGMPVTKAAEPKRAASTHWHQLKKFLVSAKPADELRSCLLCALCKNSCRGTDLLASVLGNLRSFDRHSTQGHRCRTGACIQKHLLRPRWMRVKVGVDYLREEKGSSDVQ